MKLGIYVASATALGALLSTGALAGDGNTLHITMNGAGNTTLVDQAAGGGSNIGSAGTPALQQGDNNRLWFTVGYTNNFNNDISKFYQLGNGNFYRGYAGPSASNNVLTYFRQQGNGNGAYTYWTQASNSSIDEVWIEGNNNPITLMQGDWSTTSSNNTIGKVWIVGSNNGLGGTSNGAWLHASESSATQITQVGNANKVTESKIFGSDNHNQPSVWAAGAYNRVHWIVQTGNNNGLTNSTAITNGSNGNWIKVTEKGDWNNFYVVQGADTASTQNFATLNQVGSYNDGHVTEIGSYNRVNAQQLDDGNRAYVNITGDHNGSGLFTNGASGTSFASDGALKLASAKGLVSGDVFQNTANNLTDIAITSSLNQFAVLQDGGDNNAVSGSISGGDGNQLVAVQTGASNVTSFTIVGSSNAAIVNQ